MEVQCINFVFDIDGTLTPSRLPMPQKFKNYFIDWIQNKPIYLITGSDYPKAVEQIGDDVLNEIAGCFTNAGNVLYVHGKEVYRHEWEAPTPLLTLLTQCLHNNPYPIRTGNHFEHRIGMLNFSIIGRNCTYEQRLAYYQYDAQKQERKRICEQIKAQFPRIDASVGGQISIDIYPLGKNKAQIIEYINGPIHFFGDKTELGGNDYDIASQLLHFPHKVTQVNNWQETMQILHNLEE